MRLSKRTSSAGQLRATWIVFYGQCVLWVGYLALLGLRGAYQWSDDGFVYRLCVFLGIFTIWGVWSWSRVTGYYCDLYNLFLVSLVLFSGGHAVLEIFGLNPHGILNGQHPMSVVKDCLILVVTCLMFFHTAALLAFTLHARKAPEASNREQTIPALRMVGTAMIAVSLVPACYVLYETLRTVADAGYVGLFLRSDVPTGLDAWYMILGSFLLPGALFLLAGSQGHSAGILLSWALIAIPALINLVAGSRNLALQSLAALLWLHSVAIKPIRRAYIIIGVIIALLLIPIVASTRVDPLTSSADRLETLQKAFDKMEKPFVLAIQEMGNTLQTIVYTVELVPGIKPYEWGVGYLYALSTVLPNLFWDLHPADRRGLPSAWLTLEVSPDMVRAGFGLGYSVIAEAYLNFTWIGAPLILFVIGFAVASFVLKVSRSSDPLLFATEAVMISFVLFFSRAESHLFMRPLVWQCLIPYLVVLYLRRRPLHLHTRFSPVRETSKGSHDRPKTVEASL
jgi:oligosaccharide repeat unit polymerase